MLKPIRNGASSVCQLHEKSHVIEVASNDGYLLQYFVARGVPVLGVGQQPM